MKSSKLMIAVVVLVLVPSVLAQTGTIRATMPFDFNVGPQTMAAGEYRVIVDHTTLRVAPMNAQGVNCGSFSYITPALNQDVSPKMVFHRYGNRYFLAEVWTGDVNRGHKLTVSSTEHEYARVSKAESTTVVATRMAN